MIEKLVPATVTAVATRAELPTALFAEEARSLGTAVEARRREFETGRACARQALARLDGGVCWDRVLFSAKEAVYKACFSLTGESLEFEDADVLIDAAAGSFGVRLRAGAPLDEIEGRWIARDGILATAVVVAR